MPQRILETVLTGKNLLSPVLAGASRDVAAFNSTVSGANEKTAASATASARAQQTAAAGAVGAAEKSGAAAATSASTQARASAEVVAANGRAATSASTSANTQSRAHAKAAESATLSARAQETASRGLASANGLLGTSLTPLTAGLGAVALGFGYAAFRGMEFDKSMSAVKAATQAPQGDMERLRQVALKLGADTAFSATEAADGITEMAKAGVSTTDIINGGLKGALSLAAAGQMDVAEAAELGATAMNVFGLEGNKMSHVADLLAAGAGKAQGSVSDMGQALNQSALVAAQAGISIEDTAGALAMFASNGLIGSDAGTSFKTMLQALTPNSKQAAEAMAEIGFSAYDAQGNFIGLEGVAAQLRDGLSGLTEEQRNSTLETIFGSDAVRAASVLYKEGATGVAAWADKVNDSGYAARQASQLNDNLSGDLEKLGGAFDSLMTSLGSGSQGPLRELVQGLTSIVDVIAWAVDGFTSLPGPVQLAVAAFAALTLFKGPLTSLFETVSLKAMYAADSLRGISVTGEKAGGVLSGLGKALPVVGLAFAAYTIDAERSERETQALVKAIVDGGDALEAFRAKAEATGGIVGGALSDKLNDAEKAAGALWRSMTPLEQAMQKQAEWTETLEFRLGKYGEASELTRTAQERLGFWTGEAAARQSEMDAATASATSTVRAAEDPAQTLQDRLEGVSGAAGDAKKQTDLFKTSLDILTGANVSLIEVEADFYDALSQADGALKNMNGTVLDGAGNLDVQSEAGRSTANVLFGVKDAANQLISTMIQQGRTSDEVNAKDRQLRDSFFQTALQMTGSQDAARRLTDQIYGIPEQRTTTITANTGQAVSAISGLQGQIDAIARDRTASILFRATLPDLNGSASGSGRPGLATGGHVRGPGSGTSDSIPVNLSNGEFVVKASRVREIGVDRMYDLNEGRVGFANGGLIELYANADTAGAVSGLGRFSDALGAAVARATQSLQAMGGGTPGASGPIGTGWQALFSMVHAAFPQARVNSSYRPGDPGFHGLGRAVDLGQQGFAGGDGRPYLADMNRWWYDHYGSQLAELIYDGLGDDRPDIKNGRPHVYDAATRAQHHNHVHVAREQGGPVWPGQDFLVGESGPELVRMTGNGRVIPAGRTATLLAPAAMPGYGSTVGGGIDYERLAAAMGKVSGKNIQVAVDATGLGADDMAAKVVQRINEHEWLAGG